MNYNISINVSNVGTMVFVLCKETKRKKNERSFYTIGKSLEHYECILWARTKRKVSSYPLNGVKRDELRMKLKLQNGRGNTFFLGEVWKVKTMYKDAKRSHFTSFLFSPFVPSFILPSFLSISFLESRAWDKTSVDFYALAMPDGARKIILRTRSPG